MIVGASVLQLPAIVRAKELGLHVAVADFNPQAVGITTFYNALTMYEKAVCRAAEEYPPDGIMTLATDMPMRSAARAAEQLGPHSISYATAVRATDKFDMIEAFRAHGVPAPWYRLAASEEELRALKGKMAYPCIMKPTDNAGSHGVVLVHNYEELIAS